MNPVKEEPVTEGTEQLPDSPTKVEPELSATKISKENLDLETGQEIPKHDKLKHWTDAIYDLVKKIFIVCGFVIILGDIIWTNSIGAVELIKEFYKLSLEHGRLEYIAPAVAVFVLARNLPIFVNQLSLFQNLLGTGANLANFSV